VVGLSFGGGLGLELYRRHPEIPETLVLAGAYAGWAGSLPPEAVEQRLRQALRLADADPDQLEREVVPTLFARSAPTELVGDFAASVAAFHPVGLRAMARGFAEPDLREVLPRIDVPTLLVYGDQDVRAPLSVAEELHAAIPESKLVVLAGSGI
jgi:pimeloyl-ACP methyl ester carboxylesterase